MKTGIYFLRNLKFLLPLICLAAVVFTFYGRILNGEMLFSSDTLPYQMPEKLFIRESLLAGKMPWVNPYILCGEPLLPNIDSGILNPLNLLLLAGTPLFGYSLFVFVHYLLAAFAMYFFLRRGVLCYRTVALCCAIAYSCGGYLWSMNGNGFYRCAWLIPLFFLFLLKFYRGKEQFRRIRFFALASLALAWLFLCGNFYEAYFSLCFACGAFIFTVPETLKNKRWRLFSWRAAGLALIIITGVVIALPQLLAAYNASCISARAGGIAYEEASLWSFPPLRLIEYIAPFFFGTNHGNGLMAAPLYQVPSDLKWLNFGAWPWADAVYIGMPLLLFFLPAVFCLKRGKWFYFVFSGLFFSLLVAWGKSSPLFDILRHFLPGFSMFRHPEKFIFWLNFFLLIISCSGMQAFLKGSDKVRRVFFISCRVFAGICFGMALFLSIYYFGAGDSYSRLIGQWSEWNAFYMFKWQIFSLLFPGLIVLGMFIFSRRGKLIGPAAAGLLFLQVIVYSLIIQWTLPASCLKDVRPWTDSLGAFDRDMWRILPSVHFESPILASDASEESRNVFQDPYVSRLFSVVSSLKYNTPVYFQIRSVSGFSPLVAREYIEFIDFSRRKPEYVADLTSDKYILVAGKPERLPPGDKLDTVLMDGRFSVLCNTNARPRVEAIPLESLQRRPEIIVDPESGSIRTSGPCKLLLRDRFLKGWTCVNSKGEKKDIKQFDNIFMSVDCSAPGGETLYFSYSPPEASLGDYSFCCALLLMLLVIGFRKKVTFSGKPTASGA